MNRALAHKFQDTSLSFSRHYLILFLIWPFLALLLAIKNYNKREAKAVVFMYLVYYGLTFVVLKTGYVDAMGYIEELKANAKLPFSDFFRIVGGIYTENDSIDIYEPFVSFLVSRFTTDHRILFGVFAVFYSFIYLKSIDLLNNQYQEKPGINQLVFFIFFITILPITLINGVRMWTAAWVFFYSAYHVVINRDARFLIIALLSSLVHWSFISASLILVIYYLAGNRNIVYIPVALASFVVPHLIVPFLKSASVLLGGSFYSRYEGYSNEGYISGVRDHMENTVWFIQIGNDLVYYYFIFAIIYVQLKFQTLGQSISEKNLFSFLMLFLAFVNFGRPIPSFGIRFQLVFFLFATLYLFMFFLKKEDKHISFITWAGLFPMLLYAAVTFRVGSDSISAWLMTPGFGVPWIAPVVSLAELLFY